MRTVDWQAIIPAWLGSTLLHGTLITDSTLTIRFWNDWMEQHSGLAAAQALGQALPDLAPDLGRRGLIDCFMRALAGERIALDQERCPYLLKMPVLGRPDLPHMPQEVRIGPVVVDGQIVGAVATIADRSCRTSEGDSATAQHARGMAESTVRMRDAFFSIAAHELRTPLTTLLGRAQMLQRRLAQQTADERSRRSIQIIVTQAQRLNRMISTLLDVSRIQAGRFSIDPAPMDLVALARRVVDESRLMISDRTITLQAPDAPLTIDGDEVQLEQLLQNLIGNAIKYSPNGGPIDISLCRQDGQALVTVHDQGIGISPAAQRQLFHRFYRAENADTYGISGMGIGLFVVKEIADLHGGVVSVRSAEGQGSAFTVQLPLRE